MTIYKNIPQRNVLLNRYIILRDLGEGSFGKVEECEDILTRKHVAIKTEISQEEHTLENEIKMYKILNNNGGTLGVPNLIDYGVEDGQNYMIMELLGPSLKTMLQYCGWKFSLKTVSMSAIILIELIKRVHNKGIIHRDIKPANFMVGLDETMQPLYIADLGLSKQYRDPHTQEHISENNKYHFVGNNLFCSINAHLNKELSRRDDLISIGYLLIYFRRGSLPWSGIMNEEERYRKTYKCKRDTPVEVLCKGCPEEFNTYMEYVQQLQFHEEPDYDFLISLFRNLLEHEKETFDHQFDWISKKNIEMQQQQQQLQQQREQQQREQRLTVNNLDNNNESAKSDETSSLQLYDCISSSQLNITQL